MKTIIITNFGLFAGPPRSTNNPVDDNAGKTDTCGGSSDMVFFRPLFVVPGIYK